MSTLKTLKGAQLMSIAVQAAMNQIKLDPNQVDEVICGNVISAGQGQNPARQVILQAKLPKKVISVNVAKVCASGMKSVMYGAQGIRLNEAGVVICGGFESMTNAPFYLQDVR